MNLAAVRVFAVSAFSTIAVPGNFLPVIFQKRRKELMTVRLKDF